jgi:signal transduction histidine kinase
MSVTTSESSRTGQALDLVSVIKACQAISGEMVLTELLQSLVGIAVENAGARRGLLVLEGERPLVALAETSLKDARTVTLHENIDQVPAEFSRAIMRYVERTHEVVVLGDAALAEAFQADGYIRERRPKSLLCMPLLQHKNRVGILYLENELLANAFTPERCKVLELLAAQIIISLENAKLYDTLDARVKEQTHELSETLLRLRNTQKQLVLQEKLAALGSLTSGIAHEIKNPLNFVNNFAESAVALVADLREEFRRQADVPASEKASQVDQILDELATAATKIHEHGSRVDRIIRSMLDHARSSSGAPRKVDVNEFVREHVNLALVGHGSRPEAPKLAVLVEGEYDGSLGSQLITPEDIGRVILNLAQNALHELALKKRMHGESFTPKLSVKTQNLKEQFEIRIRDNGRGIPVALRSQIFTPFFTTKAPGEGTGLGLSISHEIVVQGHGGVMEFSSEEGEYSEFVVALPKRVSAK